MYSNHLAAGNFPHGDKSLWAFFPMGKFKYYQICLKIMDIIMSKENSHMQIALDKNKYFYKFTKSPWGFSLKISPREEYPTGKM